VVTGHIDGGVAAMIAAQIGWLNPILKAAITVALVVWAFGAAFGGRQIAGVFPVLIRAAVVMTIIGSAANYTQYVQSVLNNAPTEIGNMLSGPLGAPFTGAGAFDNAINASLKAAAITYENAPMSIKGLFIIIGVLVCVVAIAYAIVKAYIVWFISLIGLKILLAVGPICIAFALYTGPTSQWAANWLGVTVSAVAAQVLVIVALVAIGFGEQQTVDNVQQGAGDNPMTELHALFIMALVSAIMSVFVDSIPSITERIFNGLAFHAAPYASALGSAARGAASAGGAVARSAAAAGGAISRATTTSSRTIVGPSRSGP